MDLRGFRRLLPATLEETAHAVGTTKGTLSKIERKKLVPRGDLLVRLQRWEERERKRRELPASARVDWAGLVRRPKAKPRPPAGAAA